MRVTKFPQSCVRLDGVDGRVLIDPGFPAMQRHNVADLGPVDAVLLTHRHPDHFDRRAVEGLLEQGAVAYGNADVREAAGDLLVQPLDDGDEAEIAGFAVRGVGIPHMPMIDGSAGPPNTGFLVDGALLHPGDGIAGAGVRADVLALPLAGPSASGRDAYRFLEEVGASRAIPIHYDVFPANIDMFVKWCDLAEVLVLGDGETVEL